MKKPTFSNATIGFLVIYLALRNLLQPIRSFTQICEVTRHQYGISKLVPRSHFAKKAVMASRYALLFSQAILPKFLEDHAKK